MTGDPLPERVIRSLAAPFPADLLLLLLWVGGTLVAVYAPVLSASPLRVLFGLPMVLILPGYALIAALFPGRGDLDGIERLALSFGLSIAVVPLIGLGLNYTPWGIRLDPILACLVVFTVAMVLVAHCRRAALPPAERFSVPFRRILQGIRAEFFPAAGSRLDRLLSIALLCAIAAAIGTTVFVIAVPKEGEHFTEFYILGPGGKAADYPSEFAAGEEQTVILGIGNHEYRTIPYTIEVLCENMTSDPATNTSALTAMALLDRWTVTVAHNATHEETYRFRVNSSDCNRIEFLLFTETPDPDSPWGTDRVNASYRDLHLWVQVR